LCFFDEIRFQNQRFDFVVNDDKLKIGNASDQLARFAVVPAIRLEVGTNAVF
jgi:hypothetical protein